MHAGVGVQAINTHDDKKPESNQWAQSLQGLLSSPQCVASARSSTSNSTSKLDHTFIHSHNTSTQQARRQPPPRLQHTDRTPGQQPCRVDTPKAAAAVTLATCVTVQSLEMLLPAAAAAVVMVVVAATRQQWRLAVPQLCSQRTWQRRCSSRLPAVQPWGSCMQTLLSQPPAGAPAQARCSLVPACWRCLLLCCCHESIARTAAWPGTQPRAAFCLLADPAAAGRGAALEAGRAGLQHSWQRFVGI